MRQFFGSILTALSIACLAASFGILSLHPALAQIGDPLQLKQIALTQNQIDDVLASEKEVDAITHNLRRNAPPSSKVIARLDGVAKKHGFASFDEYKQMSAAYKKRALANLAYSLKAKEPEIQNKGNIDLVIMNYDKIDAALGG